MHQGLKPKITPAGGLTARAKRGHCSPKEIIDFSPVLQIELYSRLNSGFVNSKKWDYM